MHSSNNDATAAEAYNVDVFSSLRLTDATFSTDYERDDTTEQVYLCFGGISYGRVVYDADKTLPSATGSWQHVFLEMTDPLGSTSSVVDRDSSELVEQITYLPYGQVDTDYRPTRWNSFREPYQYTGKEGDYEVGLSYFGARYYSPLLHRWASADPLAIHGLGGDLNPYRFVSGNPVRFVDPTGLDGGEPDVGTINDQPAPELGGTITAAPAPAPPPPPDVSQTPPPVNSPVPSDPTLEAGPPTPMLYDGGFVMATPDPPWFQEGSGGATWVDGNGTQRWNPNAHGPRAAQLFGAEGVDLVYQHQQNVELLKHSVQALSAATLLIPGLGEGVLSVELGEGALAAEGFSASEMSVVNEVRGIPLGQLRAAFEAGGGELSIGGRTIPASRRRG